jgi:hypothetical protein
LHKALLKYFPEKAYPLILVYDPDGLLNEESMLATLNERGYSLVYETNLVHLRHRVEVLKPFSLENPVIIRTEQPLDQLPYDLWQIGHKVTLALNTFFPNLAYPILKQLSPTHVWRLSQTSPPLKRLGQKGSIEHLLEVLFHFDVSQSYSIVELVIWLNAYHQTFNAMPKILLDYLLENNINTSASINLQELIESKEAFERFLQDQWGLYISNQTGQTLGESKSKYLLEFDTCNQLQDHLTLFVRSGSLSPFRIHETEKLPSWAQPGILASNQDPNATRFAELVKILGEYKIENLQGLRWEQWQEIARRWAEFEPLYNLVDVDEKAKSFYQDKQNLLNQAFLEWLKNRYSSLATKKVPTPHHLFHIPHYIAYKRRKESGLKFVLLIIDGMALSDWQLVGKTWRNRHPNWVFSEQLILAQIPTITAISRQALVSGLRPEDFAETLRDNQAEPRLWRTFWENENIPTGNAIHEYHRGNETPDWIDKPRLEAICLIENDIDDLIHHTTLGAKDFYASVKIWLEKESQALEAVLETLLSQGFTVFVTSDHGHVEASGFGKINEGLTVYNRGKRARIYKDINFAEQNQQKVSPSFIWQNDGLLPDNFSALIPEQNNAFVSHGEVAIAHGGVSLSEVIVPLVTITKDQEKDE